MLLCVKKLCTLVDDRTLVDHQRLGGPCEAGNWDVSQVTTMKQMFYATEKFNQPIGGAVKGTTKFQGHTQCAAVLYAKVSVCLFVSQGSSNVALTCIMTQSKTSFWGE